MAEVTALAAEARARAGKGTARQTRRAGRVPAVIYGNKEPAVMISLDYFAFDRILKRPGLFNHLIDLSVDGTTYRVLPRDVQLDPVTDRPLHVDFLRVGAETRLTVDVPCEFINAEKCPGLRRGGVLNIVRHTVEVTCLATAIPEQLVVNLEGFDAGDSIHISTVTMPEGVRPTITDRDFTVATIASPSGMKSDEASAA